MTITRGIIPELLEKEVDKIFFQTFMEQPQRYKAIYKTIPLDKAYHDDFRVAGTGRFQLMPEGMPVAFSNVVQGQRRRVSSLNFGLGLRITHNARRDEQHGLIRKFVSDLGASAADSQDRFAHGPYNDGWTGNTYLGLFEGDGVRRSLYSTGHVPLRNTATTQSNALNPGVALGPAGMQSALNIFQTMQGEEERFISIEPNLLFAHPDLRWDAEVLLETDKVVGSADNDINPYSSNRIGVTTSFSEKVTDRDAWSLWKTGGDALMWLDREPLRTQQATDDLTRDAIEMAFYACEVAIGEWRYTVGSSPP